MSDQDTNSLGVRESHADFSNPAFVADDDAAIRPYDDEDEAKPATGNGDWNVKIPPHYGDIVKRNHSPPLQSYRLATTDGGYPMEKEVSSYNLDNRGIEPAGKHEDADGEGGGGFSKHVETVQNKISEFWANNKRYFCFILIAVLVVLYLVYLGFAILYSWNEPRPEDEADPGFIRAKFLVTATVIVLVCVLLSAFRHLLGDKVSKAIIEPLKENASTEKGQRVKSSCKWLIFVIVILLIALFLGYETVRDDPYRLVSAVGLLLLVFFCFVFSHNPSKVQWTPVVWGIGIQIILGLFILRVQFGRDLFNWLGRRVTIFLDFTDKGSQFVFGYDYTKHFFAFKVLPIIVFFSAAINVLYYFNVMQVVISKIAWLMQKTMNTTAAESLNAAGNIFIGQTEAPLMIRPYLSKLTKSELHAVMTGGFATIAGSVLGAFISFGVSATHLMSASVMSAPAALAISKLMYPETEESKTKTSKDVELPKSEESNVIEAAANGASMSIALVANIAANLIAFLAFLEFFDHLCMWAGGLVGYPEFSVALILSYMFWPIALIMGVELKDCLTVGELLGVKTFVNEFVAYRKLATIHDQLSPRSQVIATYALCGFSNLASIGVQIGGLGAIAPERKSDLAKLAVRAMISGTIACFMTACIAGVLVTEQGNVFRVTQPSIATNISSCCADCCG